MQARFIVRHGAMRFLGDYESGRRDGRYVTASLPTLPFATGQFDLALCSHFLLLYSEQFSEAFHVESVRELCRVAREIRVFPLLTLAQEPSPHLAAIERVATELGRRMTLERVPYELQPGGNQLLRIAPIE